jgi:pimeloyl-ACP methyl ester carboxylesterase
MVVAGHEETGIKAVNRTNSILALDAPGLHQADHKVGSLFVRECGPAQPTQIGTPILFVHGAQHGWWFWRRWQPFFAQAGFRTFAMSLRNHTGSDPMPEADYLALTVFDYVDDVLAVCRWIGGPVVLVGHSMGGIVVQKAAETADLAALILCASIGPAALGVANPNPPDPTKPVRSPPDTARARFLYDPMDDATFADFYAALCAESPGVMAWTGTGRTETDPAKIRCPILCIGAEHDRTYVPKAERLAEVYGAEWIEVADAGHNYAMESVAIDVAQRLLQWLLTRVPMPRVPMPRAACRPV